MEGDTEVPSKKINWRTIANPQLGAVDPNAGRFSWSSLWTVFDALGLMIILVIQGSILNYYLILYNDGNSGWYFWFLCDFAILIMFMFSIAFAWRWYQRRERERATSILRSPFREATEQRPRRFGKGFFKFKFPKPMGMLPLIYLCWIVYSLVLVAKVWLLIILEIPEKLVEGNKENSGEIIALTLAGAAVVFLLWVEAHRNLESENQRQVSKTCIDDLISHTVFEIFDSVVFLNIIIPEDKDELKEDATNISFAFRMTIMALATLNFLMPSLGLYRLSRTHFGEKYAKLRVINEHTGLPSTRGLDISIIYHMLRLFAINVPYLIIRIHTATHIGKDLSIFILKNILGIWVALRSLIPEFKEWIQIRKLKKKVKREGVGAMPRPAMKLEQFDTNRWDMQMPTIFESKTRGNPDEGQESVALEASPSMEQQNPPEEADSTPASERERLHHGLVSTESADIIEEQFQSGLNRF